MKCRDALKAGAAVRSVGTLNHPPTAPAGRDQMVTAPKIIGIPWFNPLSNGITEGGKKFDIAASMTGTAHVDPARQVSMVEDLIARWINMIGPVPLDVTVDPRRS